MLKKLAAAVGGLRQGNGKSGNGSTGADAIAVLAGYEKPTQVDHLNVALRQFGVIKERISMTLQSQKNDPESLSYKQLKHLDFALQQIMEAIRTRNLTNEFFCNVVKFVTIIFTTYYGTFKNILKEVYLACEQISIKVHMKDDDVEKKMANMLKYYIFRGFLLNKLSSNYNLGDDKNWAKLLYSQSLFFAMLQENKGISFKDIIIPTDQVDADIESSIDKFDGVLSSTYFSLYSFGYGFKDNQSDKNISPSVNIDFGKIDESNISNFISIEIIRQALKEYLLKCEKYKYKLDRGKDISKDTDPETQKTYKAILEKIDKKISGISGVACISYSKSGKYTTIVCNQSQSDSAKYLALVFKGFLGNGLDLGSLMFASDIGSQDDPMLKNIELDFESGFSLGEESKLFGVLGNNGILVGFKPVAVNQNIPIGNFLRIIGDTPNPRAADKIKLAHQINLKRIKFFNKLYVEDPVFRSGIINPPGKSLQPNGKKIFLDPNGKYCVISSVEVEFQREQKGQQETMDTAGKILADSKKAGKAQVALVSQQINILDMLPGNHLMSELSESNYDPVSWKQSFKLPGGVTKCGVFSNDGKIFFVCTECGDKYKINLVNLDKSCALGSIDFAGTGDVTKMAISSNNRYLCVLTRGKSKERNLYFMDILNKFRLIDPGIKIPYQEIKTFIFSPDGKYFYFGGEKGFLYVLDLNSNNVEKFQLGKSIDKIYIDQSNRSSLVVILQGTDILKIQFKKQK